MQPTLNVCVHCDSIILASTGQICTINVRKIVVPSQVSCTFTATSSGSFLESCLEMELSRPIWTCYPFDSSAVGFIIEVELYIFQYSLYCIVVSLKRMDGVRSESNEEPEVSRLRFATWYLVVIFPALEHRISGNNVTCQEVADGQSLTGFCCVASILQASENEIL